MPFELPQNVLAEHLRDQPHILVEADFLAIGDCDPRTLLAAVLQCVEAEVRGARHVLVGTVDAEYPAGLARRRLRATKVGLVVPVVLKLAPGVVLSGHDSLSPRSVAVADIRPSRARHGMRRLTPVIEPRVPSLP